MKRVLRPFLLILFVLIAGVLAASVLWHWVNGPPYLMTIKPSENGAVVQFVKQTGSGDLISPIFVVPVRVDRESTVALSSRDVKMPGGVIEHADIKMKPGYFRIRFGDEVLEVMETRTIANGISHDWARQE
jgi:hypothetical protein